MTHDKVSFVREYCKCRRIPYKIDYYGGLSIAGFYICYTVYNFPYNEIVSMIDKYVTYNEYGFYKSVTTYG